jgi:hypothetical protein
MDPKQEILDLIKSNGPTLPVEVAKGINTNILLASAYVSELVSNKLLKVSHVKVGGSPVYYLSGQESKLQDFIPKLHEKEQRALKELIKAKLLKDSELEPVVRVGLRNSKDYAKPVEVQVGGEKVLFWRWYLSSKEEIEMLIRQKYVSKKAEIPKEAPKEVKPEVKQEMPITDQIEREKVIEDARQQFKPEPEVKKPVFQAQAISGSFYGKIKSFFDEHNIKLVQEDIVKKNSHFWFVVEVPASIGYISYYCEAKNKKTISSSDLSEAFVKGSSKNLPILFLSTGNVSKSVQERLETEFKNVILKKV